jgi:hypothetical protein
VTPPITRRSLGRIFGSLAICASLAVLAPTAANAQRQPTSPYAYGDDPTDPFDPPFTDIGSSAADIPTGPGVETAGDPSPAPRGVNNPDVLPDDLNPSGPGATEQQVQPGGLPRTGLELMQRVAFALLLVAAGMAARDISRRRGVFSR